MNNHIMIDIETLGKKDNAVILSIGAVLFDKDGITSEFYRELPIQPQIDAGRTIDASTLQWWLEQSTKPTLNGEELEGSLMDLHHFIEDNYPTVDVSDENPPCTYIWAHGVTFDITKLQSLFALVYNYVPWEHWQIMDCRTLIQLWPEPREGRDENNHNALDDAKNQAQWLLDLDKKLGFL